MRVTRIPGDFNDIGDRPCRVYCNEVEIEGWTVADDFRRVVETPGKVHHGAVRIDLAKGVTIPEGAVITLYSAQEEAEMGVPIPAEIQDKKGIAGTVITQVTKPLPKSDKHIPARKRKAGK